MKIKEPISIAEIHRIRENIYQETKGMTAKEKSEWIHREAEKIKKDYSLTLKQGRKNLSL